MLDLLEDPPIEGAAVPSGLVVMDLAREHRLTVYDAAYLDLGSRLQSPLVTLDGDLRAAATTAGVPVF